MSKPGSHNRLIVSEANAALRPLGLKQMGRGRLWYDDRGDSVILVEFQSHKNTPGTYLNVGICWLWRPQEYFTFDFGHRIGEFAPFVDEESFVRSVRKKVGEAIDALERYREMLQSSAATRPARRGFAIPRSRCISSHGRSSRRLSVSGLRWTPSSPSRASR